MDPFALLSLPASFSFSLPEAEKRYREVSRALHPDRFVGRPASERRLALSKAIEVNEAWRLLRDPVRRAEALLQRAGIPMGEHSSPPPSAALLMEMMELRESLSEARASKDMHALQDILRLAKNRQLELLGRLAAGFDAPSPSHDQLAALVPVLGELRYVLRLLDEASAAEDELS